MVVLSSFPKLQFSQVEIIVCVANLACKYSHFCGLWCCGKTNICSKCETFYNPHTFNGKEAEEFKLRDCCTGLLVLHNNSTHMLNYIFFSSQKSLIIWCLFSTVFYKLIKIVADWNIGLALFMDNPIDIGPHDQTSNLNSWTSKKQ